MNSKQSGTDIRRRGFLLAGSVGAAGAVAAVMVPKAQPVATVAAVLPKAGDVGYHESEHVRTYYDLARV